MDLLALKSVPLSSLPAIRAVSALLGNVDPHSSTYSRLRSTIADNILTIGTLHCQSKVLPSFRKELLSSPISSIDFGAISAYLIESLRPSASSSHLAPLYDTSLPLSVAVGKLSKYLGPNTDYSKDNSINWYSLLLSNTEGASGSNQSRTIPNSFFQTSLPISTLRELSSGYIRKENNKGSIANRQPYETEKTKQDESSQSKNKKISLRFISHFQRYLGKR